MTSLQPTLRHYKPAPVRFETQQTSPGPFKKFVEFVVLQVDHITITQHYSSVIIEFFKLYHPKCQYYVFKIITKNYTTLDRPVSGTSDQMFQVFRIMLFFNVIYWLNKVLTDIFLRQFHITNIYRWNYISSL